MALDLAKWNLADNRQWWVRLADGGTGIAAALFLTEADAIVQANRQAAGTSAAYGSAVAIVLTIEAGATASIAMLQTEYAWHIKASGQAADPVRVLRVGPFIELPEISHSIYRDARLIERKATAEIDAHTHANIARTVALGTHLPTLEPGDTAQISSTRRGYDETGQITGHRIAGDLNSLTSGLDVSFYMELTR